MNLAGLTLDWLLPNYFRWNDSTSLKDGGGQNSPSKLLVKPSK